MARTPAEELLKEVSDGLRAHEQDPVAWLTGFVNQLNQQQCGGIVAERSDLPPELASLQRPPVALVVDCGTGETKVLLYKVQAQAVTIVELIKMGPASAYVGKPDGFVSAIQTLFSHHKADIVLVAASAWLRTANSDLLAKGNRLLQQLTDAGVICKILEPREESWLELTAAEYVCEKLNLEISASWASGGGSTQMTQHFAEVHPFPIGNHLGIDLIKSDRIHGLARWRDQVRDFYSSVQVRLSNLVLCISAVFHAAEACGLPANTPIPRDEVCDAFDKYIERARALPSLSDEDIRNLANVAQQLETLRIVVREGAKLCFVRDVQFGDATMRVTWSLGWYLELLDTMQVLELPKRTLLRFRNDRAALGRIGGEFDARHRGGRASTSATGQVLLDLQQAAGVLFDRAKGTEPAVTAVLEELATRTAARLEGVASRFKTMESHVRKLKERLARLLERNRWYLLYIPKLSDVFHEVDDVLRYTVVIPTDDYVQATQLFIETLEERLNCQTKSFSFWANESTYLGINCFVTLDGFTFEIQFHTEESWDVKQNESHHIYEGFRVLSAGQAKLILYGSMKGAWSTVPIPTGVHTLTQPTPLQDALMEQLARIDELKRRLKARSRTKLRAGEDATLGKAAALDSTGLCYRLIRGKRREEFDFLAFPPHIKRLAWVSAADNLDLLFSASREEVPNVVASLMGKPTGWVEQKLIDGYSWKVVVMPQQIGLLADWDGVLQSIQNTYPEVAGKILRYEDALRKKSFKDIQDEIDPPNSFRAIKNSGETQAQHIDLRCLLEQNEPRLWQVRGFLFNVVGLNELYRGDGHVYNDRHERQASEFLVPNIEIGKITGSEVFLLEI